MVAWAFRTLFLNLALLVAFAAFLYPNIAMAEDFEVLQRVLSQLENERIADRDILEKILLKMADHLESDPTNYDLAARQAINSTMREQETSGKPFHAISDGQRKRIIELVRSNQRELLPELSQYANSVVEESSAKRAATSTYSRDINKEHARSLFLENRTLSGSLRDGSGHDPIKARNAAEQTLRNFTENLLRDHPERKASIDYLVSLLAKSIEDGTARLLRRDSGISYNLQFKLALREAIYEAQTQKDSPIAQQLKILTASANERLTDYDFQLLRMLQAEAIIASLLGSSNNLAIAAKIRGGNFDDYRSGRPNNIKASIFEGAELSRLERLGLFSMTGNSIQRLHSLDLPSGEASPASLIAEDPVPYEILRFRLNGHLPNVIGEIVEALRMHFRGTPLSLHDNTLHELARLVADPRLSRKMIKNEIINGNPDRFAGLHGKTGKINHRRVNEALSVCVKALRIAAGQSH